MSQHKDELVEKIQSLLKAAGIEVIAGSFGGVKAAEVRPLYDYLNDSPRLHGRRPEQPHNPAAPGGDYKRELAHHIGYSFRAPTSVSAHLLRAIADYVALRNA